MAYNPSLEDIPDQSYQPSLSDIDDSESSSQSDYANFMASIGKPTTEQSSNLFRGMAAGIMELGRGIANYLPKIESAAGIKPSYQPITADEIGTTKVLPPELAKTDEGKAGFLTGQLLASSTVPMGEGGMLAKAGKTFLTGEALSPVYAPDESLSESFKQGLLPSVAGAAAEPTLKAIKAVPELFMTMGGTASPEEFARNVAAVGSKPVGTPELAQAPYASKFEQNFLGNFPLSGVQKNNMAVGKGIDDDINQVLTNLNVVPEDKPKMRYGLDPETGQYTQPIAVKKETQQEKIAENFQQNVAKNEAIKRNFYNARDQAAANTPGSFTADTRKAIADKHLSDIQKEIDENGFTTVSPATMQQLESASRNNPVSFSRLNFNRKTYDDMADQFLNNGNLYEAKIMNNLQDGYNTDIKNAINQPGNEALASAQRAADFHFKNKIAPIRNDDVLMAQSRASTATPNRFISDVISGGRYDDPTTIDIVKKNLDPDFQKQFTHEYLTQGSKQILDTDELGSDKVLSTYGKLGDETKRIMFSPEDRKTLDSAYKTRGLMGQSVNAMLNPKTGYTHGSAIGLGAAGAMTHSLANHLMGLGMSPVEAYPAALATLTGTGNLLAKYLTSNTSRNLYSKGAQLRGLDISSPVNLGLLMQSSEGNQ